MQLVDGAVGNEQCLFYSLAGTATRSLRFSPFTLSVHLISLFTVHSLSLSLFLSRHFRAYQDFLGKLELQVTLAGRCSEKHTKIVSPSLLADSFIALSRTLLREHSHNNVHEFLLTYAHRMLCSQQSFPVFLCRAWPGHKVALALKVFV